MAFADAAPEPRTVRAAQTLVAEVCGPTATYRKLILRGDFAMSDPVKSPEVPHAPAAGQPSSIQIPVDASKMQAVYANFDMSEQLLEAVAG